MSLYRVAVNLAYHSKCALCHGRLTELMVFNSKPAQALPTRSRDELKCTGLLAVTHVQSARATLRKKSLKMRVASMAALDEFLCLLVVCQLRIQDDEQYSQGSAPWQSCVALSHLRFL